MAEIRPFRALRYAARIPVGQVVTQPYDKISVEMAERYRNAHPNNLVSVLLPASGSGAGPSPAPYQQAAETFRRWRGEGIIEQIEEPSLFAYFQEFRIPGSGELKTRKGFIGLTRLEDYAAKVVFPHERTLSGPKRDRLELLRHTRTHFGQVFLLYVDAEHRIDTALDRVADPEADVLVRDEYGVDHMLWRISSPETIALVQREMTGKPLIIADGHHRYETALAYRDEQRRGGASARAGDSEWLMATLVNMESEGLTILPTHRVLAGLRSFDGFRLLERARAFFHVRDVSGIEELRGLMHTARRDQPRIGIGLIDRLACLDLRDGLDASRLMPHLSPSQAGLDVVILHALVLEKCLGVSEADVGSGRYLEYVRDFGEAFEAVRSKGAQACFLLNPTRADQVRDIAFSGEVLPQKSTDFFPKLLSGLTMYSIEAGGND